MSCQTVSPTINIDRTDNIGVGNHHGDAKDDDDEGIHSEGINNDDMGDGNREAQEEMNCRECDPMNEEVDDDDSPSIVLDL